jgi:hypothetical protein
MAVVNLYSKRRKAELKAGEPEVYRYDVVPPKLRGQVVHIWREALGDGARYAHAAMRWRLIENLMAREEGLIELAPTGRSSRSGHHQFICEQWFLSTANDEQALDMIDLTFGTIDRLRKHDSSQLKDGGIWVSPDGAIDELNQLFLEHGLGFQFENGILVPLRDGRVGKVTGLAI